MTDEGRLLFDEGLKARRRQTVAAALAVLVAAGCMVLGLGATTNAKLRDLWFRVRGDVGSSPPLVLVEIDEKTIRSLGHPVPNRRDYVAIVKKLQEAGASVIAFDVVFTANDTEPEATQELADVMRAAGNVVFALSFNDVGQRGQPDVPPTEALQAQALLADHDDGSLAPTPARNVEPPDPILIAAAAAVGHANILTDRDGVIRSIPLLMEFGERVYPSFALQIARVHAGEPASALAIENGLLQAWYNDVPVSKEGMQLIDWPSTELAFERQSFLDVVRGDVPLTVFRDPDGQGKAVIIAPTAVGLGDARAVPFGPPRPGATIHAAMVENLFAPRLMRSPSAALPLEYGLFATLAILGIVLFPRLGVRPLLIVGVAASLLPVALSFVIFRFQAAAYDPLYPLLAALLPFALTLTMKLRATEKVVRDVSAEKVEAQKLLGLSFQEKGMLDMALGTFEKLPMTDDMKRIYLNLGLDFANKGQQAKAFVAYKRVFELDPKFEDIEQRMGMLRDVGVQTRAFAQPTVQVQMTASPQAPVEVPGFDDGAMDDATRNVLGPPTDGEPDGDGDATGVLGVREDTGPTVNLQPGTATAAGATAASSRGAAPKTPTAPRPTAPPAAPAAPPAGAPTIGQRLGRYEIVKQLGRGGMGEVYLVSDITIGRTAAMKTIRPDVEMSPAQAIEMRQRFYREAQTAGRLAHPNIVTIHDVGEEQGIAYIVMEFIEGDTLTGLIRKGGLSVKQIQYIIIHSALALDFAHQGGVFHRDIKPDNIMITKGGVVKVMDFGIARVVESELTRTGSVLGTPSYMAPEQFAGRKVDGRSDVFSLGVVLYLMVTGRRPFVGQTATSLMFAIMQEQPQPPSLANSAASAAWDPVLARALAKNPDERYATAREFAEAVRDVKV